MCGGVVGDIGESIDKAITQPIGKGLSEVDTFVNREISWWMDTACCYLL